MVIITKINDEIINDEKADTKTDKAKLTVYIPLEASDELKLYALKKRISVSALMTKVINDFLEKKNY